MLATVAATTTAMIAQTTSVNGFAGNSAERSAVSSSSSASELFSSPPSALETDNGNDESTQTPTPPTPPPNRRQVRMSEALPFLRSPAHLTGELPGDVGFDPFGFGGGSQESVMEMREAEVKHARLAMLAAVGWPFAELFDRQIAAYLGVPTVLDASDRVQFDRIVPEWWGFCLGMTAAIDLYGVRKKRSGDPRYFPGNLGFDPLGLYPEDEDGQRNMQLAEIKHGRLAMLAVAGYAAQEAVSNVGVVDEFLYANAN